MTGLGTTPLAGLIWVLAVQVRDKNRHAARILKGKAIKELTAFSGPNSMKLSSGYVSLRLRLAPAVEWPA